MNVLRGSCLLSLNIGEHDLFITPQEILWRIDKEW